MINDFKATLTVPSSPSREAQHAFLYTQAPHLAHASHTQHTPFQPLKIMGRETKQVGGKRLKLYKVRWMGYSPREVSKTTARMLRLRPDHFD